MRKKILVADDEHSIREFFQILLKKMSSEGEDIYEMVPAEDGQKALDLIKKQSFDMVISDLKMPHLSGLELLEHAKALKPDIVFILITAFDTSDTAVKALKKGAYDYIPKPFNVNEIKTTVANAFHKDRVKAQNQQLKIELEQKGATPLLVGKSLTLKKIYQEMEQIAHSTSNILITGESGTGKEVVARFAHSKSFLRDKPFVAVNCGAVPDTLIESEMFGHKKGAFTGAHTDKKGFFEMAKGGALFLDEIGDLPLAVQPKLLRALQEKTIRMVGDTVDKQVEVRLISATNRDLEAMVRAGKFREDLFYRLNVIRFNLPKLRDRKEDIPLLVEHFLKKHSHRLGIPVKTMSHSALSVFCEYKYPGNVRELENLVERAIVLSTGETITKEDVLPVLGAGLFSAPDKKTAPNFSHISLPAQGMDMEVVIGNLETRFLKQALERAGGSKVKASKLLGLSSRAFRYRLRKYNLESFVNDN